MIPQGGEMYNMRTRTVMNTNTTEHEQFLQDIRKLYDRYRYKAETTNNHDMKISFQMVTKDLVKIAPWLEESE